MRKTTQLVLAFVGLNVFGLLLLGWSMALSMVTDPTLSPYWEVQAPDREVGLGGQRVFFRESSYMATASFYPGDGTMVAVGHAGQQLAVGQITSVTVTDRDNVIFCNVKVLVNTDQGVTLGMPKETRVNTELIRLGGTADIVVGEVATVHPGIAGPFKVRVAGYMQFRGEQLLVVSSLHAKDRIELGMSGSPIAPNTLEPTEDQVREAHRQLVEKHEIDLGRYEVVTNWSQMPTLHVAGLTGEALMHAAIQDAQREYRETTRFPPLILHDEDRRVLLVGYLQKDGRAVVVRYVLGFTGWTKTVAVK